MSTSRDTRRIRVAIIGGGITGIILALGLQKRGVDYILYERASAFTEIGAGIGFSPNAERALAVVDPEVYRIYKQVAPTTDGEEFFQWIDGYKTNEFAARLSIGVDSFQGGRRSDFLEAWSTLIDKNRVKFGKSIVSVNQDDDGEVSLNFMDGTTEKADIVIGCDGIRSRVRQLILGEGNLASYPSYSNKYCFRALVPMDKVREALGEERSTGSGDTLNRLMYIGPGAHVINYPVGKKQVMNILLVMSDPNPWRTSDGKQTAPGSKADATRAFADWHPFVRAIVDLLPDELQKWGIFDMFEHPAPHYNLGSMAVAGDAAHAAGPHLGSGAGFGIEDALVLASLLEAVNKALESRTDKTKVELCHAALAAYNNVRYDRTQWLVRATREACALFHWEDPEIGGDVDRFLPEISKRFHQIWDNDILEMVRGALVVLDQVLDEKSRGNTLLPN
ncbi:FAD/NAD(P)-binding domain-containing protein [Daldinia caldariorum]|uniref:FAD/NAD(P)-binding domain-containing protein n=1 Tax=Daldinia caldariorum TaxID=326644 RepID=UPI0020073C5E|nr:FAD/NAD(P)-binding domain-containing protein [Daldinia caldariorum]KAI1472191.1 FAD/NAD(P)-binding domain-containing protein [Daldinia caldariorum]